MITLFINDRFKNRKVDFFNEVSFNLAYDSIASQFGFSFYFNPDNVEHKELSCVSHFHEVVIKHNDVQFLKGQITNQSFSASSKKELSNFSGYSLPGVLEDCQIPPSIYPLQSDGLSLSQIAAKLIKPFNLEMVVDPSVASKMNKSFKTTTATETQTVKDYLTKLASQKDIIMSHDEFGRLLFTQAATTKQPILYIDLTKPTPDGVKYSMEYDGQNMHSHITLLGQSSIDGGNAKEYTIRNPYVIGSVYRPKVMSQSSGDDIDTSLAARRALGNELRNVKVTITIDKWLLNDDFIRPNNTISIYAPELYLYNKQDWFIESVNYSADNRSETCVLNCVLPYCYNDDEVVNIFRGINLHALDE